MYEEHVKEINKVIRHYFDGIYDGNVDLLREGFAQDAKLYGDVKGEEYAKTLDEYLAGVAARKSPAKLNEKFDMEIIGIEVIGNVAMAKLHLKMLGFNYYDFLSLCIVEGDWKIVNKLFSHVE